MVMIIIVIMIMTLRGGLGGVGPCLFPSAGDALDANESLSGKGFLFHYSLARTASFEDTITASHKQNPRVPSVFIPSIEAHALTDALNETFISTCVFLTDVYLND
jgi:hypothetical protein